MAGNRSLGSLVIDLIAKTSGFEAGMDRAARVTDKRMKEIEKRAKIAGAAIGAGLAAAGAITARSIKSAIDQADDLSKWSQKIGISTEALSRLDYAAKLSDVSLDQLGNGVKRLGQFQVEAINGGNEQALILDRLGISAKDAATGGLKDAETMLQELAGIFERLPDGADKTALSIKLFGKSGAELIPLLNNGAKGLQAFAEKADRVGYTITSNTGKAAEAFNDTLSEVGLSIDGLWRQSLPLLLPKLQDFADIINSEDFRQGFATIIGGAVNATNALAGLVAKVGDLGQVFKTQENQSIGFLEKRLGGLRNEIKAIQDDPTGVWGARELIGLDRDSVIEDIRRQMAPIEAELLERRKALVAAALGDMDRATAKPIDVAGLGLGTKPTTGSSKGRELPDFSKGAAADLQALIDKVASARAGFDAMAATLAGPLAAANYQYKQDQAELNELARVGEIDAIRLTEAQANLAKEYEANVKAIQAQLTPAEAYIESLKEENAFLAANRDQQAWMTAARYSGADATAAQVREAYELLKVNEQLAESMRNWDELNRNIADSLFDVVTGAESAGDAIKGFFDNLNRQILQNFTQDWADSITDFLKSFGRQSGGDTAFGFGSFSSGGGNWWANLLSAFGFGGGKAGGGRAAANTIYEVNEQGLEMATVRGRDYLLTGGSGATITPAHKVGVGGLQQTNNFTIQGRIDRRTQDQIAAEVGRRATTATRRNGW